MDKIKQIEERMDRVVAQTGFGAVTVRNCIEIGFEVSKLLQGTERGSGWRAFVKKAYPTLPGYWPKLANYRGMVLAGSTKRERQKCQSRVSRPA